MGSGRGNSPAECGTAEWSWELGNHKFVVVPVHKFAVFSLTELSLPVMRTPKMFIGTETEVIVNPNSIRQLSNTTNSNS